MGYLCIMFMVVPYFLSWTSLSHSLAHIHTHAPAHNATHNTKLGRYTFIKHHISGKFCDQVNKSKMCVPFHDHVDKQIYSDYKWFVYLHLIIKLYTQTFS